MMGALEKRSALTERLVQALEPMTMAQAVGILASFIHLAKLQEIVEFQEGRS